MQTRLQSICIWRTICSRTLGLLVGILAVSSLSLEAKAITLLKDGASEYTIVTPDEPTIQEQFAASELQKYLAIMTGGKAERRYHDNTVAKQPFAVINGGVKLDVQPESKATGKKIVVAVAPRSKAAAKIQFAKGDEDYDAFAIETDGNDLLLIGSNKRAVIYAVYALLENKLGCRWMSFGQPIVIKIPGGTDSSTEIDEFVPSKTMIAVGPLHERHKAAHKFRGFSGGGGWGDCPAQVADWAMKQRLNYVLMCAESYANEWSDNVVGGYMVPRGVIVAVGHHSFHNFLDPKKYFGDHPDWFALVGGKRIPGGRSKGQFCISNPDAVRTYHENVLAYAAKHPEIDVLALYPNDGGGWCECEKCKTNIQWKERPKAEAKQDIYLKLLNPLAPQIAAKFPGKRIMEAAYVEYSDPPKNIQPAAGIDVHYAYFTRNWFTDPMGNADGPLAIKSYAGVTELNRTNILQWLQLTKANGGNVIMYEYYTGRSSWDGRPYPLMHLIQQELAYFQKIGVAGCTVQLGLNVQKNNNANLYIYAKALWDTKLDVDTTLKDYYEHRYGKAAAAIENYYSQMEDNARHMNKYMRAETSKRDKGLADCQQYLDEGKALADSERVKKLIAEEQSAFDKYRKFQISK